MVRVWMGLSVLLAAFAVESAVGQGAVSGRDGLLFAVEDVLAGVPPHVRVARTLLFIGTDGRVRHRVRMSVRMGDFVASPGGRRLAYQDVGGVFVADARGRHRRLVIRDAYSPAWSPDGRRLAVLVGTVKPRIVVADADSRHMRILTRHRGLRPPLAWSADARRIGVMQQIVHRKPSPCAQTGVAMEIRPAGGRLRRLFVPQGRCAVVTSVDWSPDGLRLVARIDDATRPDAPVDPTAQTMAGIVVADADGGHARRIAVDGRSPVWSPSGRAIAVVDACPTVPAGLQPVGVVCILTMRPDGAAVRSVAPVRSEIQAGFSLAWLRVEDPGDSAVGAAA